MSAPAAPQLRWSQRLPAAAGVFVAALTLYTLTLAPTVTFVDSGELVVAAHSLGVAHPPGFPLYVLLAHAATWLPFGDVARRVNFASAFFAAAAAAVMVLVAAEALTCAELAAPVQRRASSSGRKTSQHTSSTTQEPKRRAPVSPVVPALVGAWLLACSRTLWSYATITEVYSLNTLLMLLVFLLVFEWRRTHLDAARSHRKATPSRSALTDRRLYAAALLVGLALGVHHVTIGLTLPALVVLVYASAGRSYFTAKRVGLVALWGGIGMAVYLYLPIAAARAPLLNWGDPRTAQRLWWHVTGRQYLESLSFSFAGVAHQAVDFLRRSGREFGPWWFPAGPALALLGFVELRQRDRALFYCLVAVVLCDLAYAFNYDIAEDKDAYYLPTFVCAALAAALGARRLIALAGDRRAGDATARRVATVAVLLVPTVALVANLPFNNRSRYFLAHDYVENILRTVAPRGMLLTYDWQVWSPMQYVRTIEKRRPDLVLIDLHLLRRSWYFDYLQRQYPDLVEHNRDMIDPFLEDLRAWEADPERYARDAALTRRIDSRFHQMIVALVSRHLQSAPVYATQDVVLGTDPRISELARALSASYELVPQGLVFQLLPDRNFHEPAAPQLATRGLADGTLRFDSDDVVTLKVFPVYVSMLYNRGRYLALHGHHEQAVEAFQQSLALNPDFTPAKQALAESTQNRRAQDPR